LYERNYAGNHEDNRIQTLGYATATGKIDQLKGFVDTCLNEYDLNGWTAPDLINPTDVGLFGKK
jgi:4-hydroxyphenylacetate 3-monooxygenase